MQYESSAMSHKNAATKLNVFGRTIMLEMGFIVCLGLTFWFCKCGWKTRMWILSHALFIDIAVFILLNLIHWGTYSGVMVAAIASVMTSILLTLGRKMFGYIVKGDYKRGMWDFSDQIGR
jgi:hypothetical protein